MRCDDVPRRERIVTRGGPDYYRNCARKYDTTVYVKQAFSSFEEFNSFPNGWDTEFHEAGTGSALLEIETLSSGNILINTAGFGQPTLQRGSTPGGMRTFALPVRLSAEATWLDRQISPTSLMLFPESGELFCVAGGAMTMATVSVANDLFDTLADSISSRPHGRLDAGELCDIDGERWSVLHRKIGLFARFSRQYGHLGHMADWRCYFEEALAGSLLECFADADTSAPRVSASAAAGHVRRASVYILAHLDESLSVGTLCAELGVSRRCLEYSFARAVGISPKRFVLELRFARCHAELLSASTGSTTVSATANRWGIWHLGQFASSYQSRYGEHPSRTLARSPGKASRARKVRPFRA